MSYISKALLMAPSCPTGILMAKRCFLKHDTSYRLHCCSHTAYNTGHGIS